VDDQRPLHGQPSRQVREARGHLGKPRALATSDSRGQQNAVAERIRKQSHDLRPSDLEHYRHNGSQEVAQVT
jgi:hypothetical protein